MSATLLTLKKFMANGQAAQAEVDEKLRSINPTPLLCRAAVRKLLLEHAKKTRAHPFTRVSEQTLIELNESVRWQCVLRVSKLPSKGKTI